MNIHRNFTYPGISLIVAVKQVNNFIITEKSTHYPCVSVI